MAPAIDALCSLTGFSRVGGPPSRCKAAAGPSKSLMFPLSVGTGHRVPVPREAWQASSLGLTPLETTLMVAIPDARCAWLDGDRRSPAITAARPSPASARNLCQCRTGRACMNPTRSGSRFSPTACLDGRASPDRTGRTPHRHGAVSIIRPMGGNIGTAAFLAVFESLHATMKTAEGRGLPGRCPERVDCPAFDAA